MADREGENESKTVHPADEFADVDFSPMSDEELAFLADKLFQMYDEEEASRERKVSDKHRRKRASKRRRLRIIFADK